MPTPLNKSLQKTIRSQIKNDKRLFIQINNMINGQFRSAKEKLIKEFEEHAITRELKAGPSASNISGVVPKGNLFSFIGFESGENPTEGIENLLNQTNILIKQRPMGNLGLIWTYAINIAPIAQFYSATPLPWASGASWLRQLEGGGIPNLGQYLFKRAPSSRSGTGVQSKLREGGGRAKAKYLKPLLEKFEREIDSISGATRISKRYF